MCVQIRNFLQKSEIQIKLGIYNSDMSCFGAISYACLSPKLTSSGNDRLASAPFL